MLLPYHTTPGFLAAGSATAASSSLPHVPLHNGTNDAISPISTKAPGHGYYDENWSSLIGILTAVGGNILISFALNVQRYAHIRLEREDREKELAKARMEGGHYRDEEDTDADGDLANGAPAKGERGQKPAEYNGHDERGYNSADAEPRSTANEQEPLLPRRRTTSTQLRPNRTHKRTSTNTSASSSRSRHRQANQTSYLRSPVWWTGIILMALGETGNFLAYGFAPASIVSPLGVVALISNCIIAPIMLKEPFRLRDGLGVLIAVAGAVTVVFSASQNNPKLGPDEIWGLISTWEFEAYFAGTVVLGAVLWVGEERWGWGERSVLVDLGLVALFGGYTALSTKGVASLLSYTLWRSATFPVTYLLLAILIFTAIMQIKYVNRALQRYNATQVIPVQFVLFTLSVILGSAVLYRDFERTSKEDAGKFVGGCALTFAGVWCITGGRHGKALAGNDEESGDGSEEGIGLRYQDEPTVDVDGATDGDGRRLSSPVRSPEPPIAIAIECDGTPSSLNGDDDPSTSPTRQHHGKSARHTPASDASGNGNNATWAEVAAAPPPSSNSNLNPNLTLSHPPPPPPHRHSSPILQSEATTTSSHTTLASASDSNLLTPRPSTPTRGVSDTAVPVTPVTPGTATSRLRRLETGSGAIIGSLTRSSLGVPGPLLASPLSTTLSAMVADLKRSGTAGVGSMRGGGDTRRGSVLAFSAAADGDGRDFGEPLERRRTGTGPQHETREGCLTVERGENMGRARSISDALGDLWRRGVSARGAPAAGSGINGAAHGQDVD